MSSEEVVATPGVNRLVEVVVNGHRFAYRRPSRADVAETRRRMATRLANEMHEYVDGRSLEWEAALEIGLQPQLRGGVEVPLGEAAPEHWFKAIRDADGKQVGKGISFLDVPNEEFIAVVEALGAELGKKKP